GRYQCSRRAFQHLRKGAASPVRGGGVHDHASPGRIRFSGTLAERYLRAGDGRDGARMDSRLCPRRARPCQRRWRGVSRRGRRRG
ncbi:unnamed protein product, partial [Ectocarpus fasciculatus]